jgi:hypothetical protein
MSDSHNQAELALRNAAAALELTKSWHARMRELDERAPKVRLGGDDDPKRGCLSPLGGRVW